MPRTITPEQYRSTLRAALRVAIEKGLDAEARQVTALLRDLNNKIGK